MSIWSYLVIPFGYIMRFCYNLFNSYGVALFLYAIITKLLLLPLSVKQQKSQLEMVRLKPYQDDLMKKYGGNKQKYQDELMKLYQQHGYSPMSSCLPTAIQLPIIMLIYTIVRRPLTYLAGFSLTEIWTKMQPYLSNDAFAKATTENFTRYELQLFTHLSADNAIDINSKFLGIFDLALKPSEFMHNGNFWLILIPILAGVTAFLTGWFAQKLNPTSAADPASSKSMKMMNVFMPLISVWISYTYTSALGLYWIASNIVAIGQTFLLNKLLNPQRVLKEVEDKIASDKQAEKEKRRLAAEKRALSNNKNSKKKRALNGQYSGQLKSGVVDTEKRTGE